MATDWIKMRSDLYRDPKVCAIADSLLNKSSELSAHVNQNCQCDMTVTRNVLRNAAVGCLVAVWGVARHRGKRSENDLVLKNTHISVIDDISDLPGFGAAMLAVEWVKELDNALIFPNFFEEFNVDPDEEKNRKNAERQKRHREKVRNELRNVTPPLQSNAREEKRREEINHKPSAVNGKISLSDNGNWIGIYPAQIEVWKQAYPAVLLEAELHAAAAWILANPANKKSNYARFITNWLKKQQDRAPRVNQNQKTMEPSWT